MVKYLIILVAGVFAACSTVDPVPEENLDEHAVTISRRIERPAHQDTLRLSTPFRLKAAVDCHNPIIGLRIEITDKSLGVGDGEVLARMPIPAAGTTEVRVDTMITLEGLSRQTPDQTYGFILVEVYEGREYRSGFEPIYVLE